MQLTCSPVYSISLFTFNFTKPLPEPAYTWTTPDYRSLENRPRENMRQTSLLLHPLCQARCLLYRVVIIIPKCTEEQCGGNQSPDIISLQTHVSMKQNKFNVTRKNNKLGFNSFGGKWPESYLKLGLKTY